MARLLALDQGTTSSRAILFDEQAKMLATAQQEFEQHFPDNGWVEHDPNDLWQTQLAAARQVLKDTNTSAEQITGIGITNQRETTILWDRNTGDPIYNAIVWQDRRTAAFCDRLRKDGHTENIQQRTGLVPDAYFSASKINWLLENVPDAHKRAQRGELAFGTVDTWLLWNLTGGRVHATDPTNAARTMLYNLHDQQWDPTLLEQFAIPESLLPEVHDSSGIFGQSEASLLGKAVPIAGIAGDQQAALFGQTCFKHGVAKNTYGTGCFLLMHTGHEPTTSKHQLLTTIASRIDHQVDYALEGSVFIGGAVVQWLRDGLKMIQSASDVEKLARSVEDNGGVYLVPAFAGLGAPHWDQYARGTITGLTRGTTAGHFARAALEGIAYQVADVLEVMQEDTGLNLPELRVDGGAAANDLLMQFQADILRVPVVRPKVTETTALGAAFLAGLATDVWPNREALIDTWQIERTFEPMMKETDAAHHRERWREALERARDWEQK